MPEGTLVSFFVHFLSLFISLFFFNVFLISALLPASIRQMSTVVVRGLGRAFLCLSVCLSSMAPLSTFARLFFRLLSSYFYFTSIFWLLLGYPCSVDSLFARLFTHAGAPLPWQRAVGHDLGHVRGLRLTLGGLKRHAVDALLVGALGCSLCSST